MIRSQQPALTLFAVGMIGLGILALVYGDFAMVWQPVASWIPGRSALAYGSGLVMLLGGTGLLMRATAAWSARLLFPYLIGWLLLKVPALLEAPQTEAVWLGVGELAVLLAGGWVLFARLAGLQEGSPLSFATGQNGLRIALILFAVALIPIGLSHIVYVKPTADLVPAWLPYRMGWAYVTDRLRSRRDVFRPSACRRKNGSGNDQPVYAARLGPCDSGRSHDTVAVDGVLHLLGYRISRMGSRPKHRTESACQTEGITEVHRLQNRLCARRVLAKLVATQTSSPR
jgi:uncharacterized membrane protein